MPTRDSLHRLIDELPESELAVAERFLHYLHATTDPVLRALIEALIDDEPETEEERQVVQAARFALLNSDSTRMSQADLFHYLHKAQPMEGGGR
jgi:hypothetical protein